MLGVFSKSIPDSQKRNSGNAMSKNLQKIKTMSLCSSKKEKPSKKVVKSLANRYAENISNGVCSACNGYYGPAHGQAVCATCHAFLYANDLDQEVNLQLASVERESDSDSDHDSGNDEPQEFLFKNSVLAPPVGAVGLGAERNESQEGHSEASAEPMIFFEKKAKKCLAHHHLQPIKVESLSEKLAQLSLPRNEGNVPENVVDILPPEVLLVIFAFLDDISVFAVGNVCRR